MTKNINNIIKPKIVNNNIKQKINNQKIFHQINNIENKIPSNTKRISDYNAMLKARHPDTIKIIEPHALSLEQIEKYVSEYPEGTFKKVSVPYDFGNGEKGTIIYEGLTVDFDIDSIGRMLRKQRAVIYKQKEKPQNIIKNYEQKLIPNTPSQSQQYIIMH